MNELLGAALDAPGHFIQDIGRFVHPATLLRDRPVFFLKRQPEAERTIANG
jgi:hypothetical protein